MKYLFINTAAYLSEIRLVERDKVIFELSQKAQFDEYETIFNFLKQQRKTDLLNLDYVICITGPGSFTGVRVGVTIANTLALMLKVPLYGLDIFAYLSAIQKLPVLVDAGKDEFYIKEKQKIEIRSWQTLKDKYSEAILFAKEGVEEGVKKHIKIKNYFEIEKKSIDINKLDSQKTIQPIYIRPPSITIPKGGF